MSSSSLNLSSLEGKTITKEVMAQIQAEIDANRAKVGVRKQAKLDNAKAFPVGSLVKATDKHQDESQHPGQKNHGTWKVTKVGPIWIQYFLNDSGHPDDRRWGKAWMLQAVPAPKGTELAKVGPAGKMAPTQGQ